MDPLSNILGNEFYRNLISTSGVIVAAMILRQVFYRLVIIRLPDESPYIFTIRKIANYLINILAVLVVFSIWLQNLGDLSVALGIMAAGLAFALQEVIGSIAGWITVITGQPFTIGDRIETGGIRGDVVDISLLRTKIMETGNWLHGDHNTGRIVTVSNAFIFKEPLFNYSRHLSYIWDEIDIPIIYDSDWKKAITLMSAAVYDHPKYQELLPKAQSQRRHARREFAIKITSLEPRVFLKMTDNWIELGMVYPVDNEIRRIFNSEISAKILDQFQAAGITVASQTISIVKFPEKLT